MVGGTRAVIALLLPRRGTACALDYLETRPEVDKTLFGVTGRSGGGAYSWWIAALDERIQAACPVAGITDLENHVVDGGVEKAIAIMFMVNTYRWDRQVAALISPRPLLMQFGQGHIFPLDDAPSREGAPHL
jgi:hypothetical protein